MVKLVRLLPLLVVLPATALAQTDVEWLGRRNGVRPPPIYYEILRANPNAFQFSRDNGWIQRGRAVSARRSAARGAAAEGDAAEGVLFAPLANLSDGVLRGTLSVPVLLPLFNNTDSAAIVAYASQSTIQEILFRTAAAPPYSVTTFYREISQDSLEVTGAVLPWLRVSRDDTYYEDGQNGQSGKVRDLIIELVAG